MRVKLFMIHLRVDQRAQTSYYLACTDAIRSCLFFVLASCFGQRRAIAARGEAGAMPQAPSFGAVRLCFTQRTPYITTLSLSLVSYSLYTDQSYL